MDAWRDGPKGHIGFAPRLTSENFKAPFTSAEGWGTFSQQRTGRVQAHRLRVKHGRLILKTFAFELPTGARVKAVTAKHGAAPEIAVRAVQRGTRVEVALDEKWVLNPGADLSVIARL